LQGALVDCLPDKFRLVATDSHRLARSEAAYGEHLGLLGEVPSVLLPNKSLEELFALLTAADDEGVVEYAALDAHLFFEVSGRHFFSRRIDGTFPAWEKIYPKDPGQAAVLDRELFRAALKRVRLLAVSDKPAVVLDLTPGSLSISSETADLGAAAEPVPAEYAGAALTLRFQAQYLEEFLGAASSPTITMWTKSDVLPALLTDGPGYGYVLMPMRA
jgi:DNA polymerase-3 subunit beta